MEEIELNEHNLAESHNLESVSPSSLLESPVLLSNMKVEPSPTTGSLLKPHTMSGPGIDNLGRSTSDEGNVSIFDGDPGNRLNTPAGLSSTRPQDSVSGTFEQIEPYQPPSSISTFVQVYKTSTFPTELDSSETALNQPLKVVAPGAVQSVEIASNGLQQSQNLDFQPLQLNPKETIPSPTAEKSLDDGYNWRKYGQKLVKGSEFPRSYYKCTHPNCQVKMQMERSYDGRITEIIYRGRHEHPKPQPKRRLGLGGRIHEENLVKFPCLSNAEASNAYGHVFNHNEQAFNMKPPPLTSDDDGDDDDNDNMDDPDTKRRKQDTAGGDSISLCKPPREPRVVVQTLSEVDILDDGYRWRKYGQKVVKGNHKPRSYYKCTNMGCPVRKHVERASHDPKAVITTYEGKHNHDVPVARTSSHETAGPSTCITPTVRDMEIGSDETNAVGIDLGVGIGSSHENRSLEKRPSLDAEFNYPQEAQATAGSSSAVVIYANPESVYYHLPNTGGRYAITANHKNFSFSAPALNSSSSSYPWSTGG
ncbi:WRKY domain [Dillenia turbinata]|uniref:WRKY domain n=1 Tax=Dillenia turbinata TaxID=194707 RepID=A0AAN8VNM6_9MAGN